MEVMKNEYKRIISSSTFCLHTHWMRWSENTDIKVEDLTGTWVRTMSDGKDTLTLNSDMTYHKVIELGGSFPVTTESSDTWSVNGSTISINYSDYNTVSTYTVKLDGNKMSWDNGDSVMTYQKK